MPDIEQLCAELAKLPDEASRAAFLNGSPQLRNAAVVEQLAEAVRRKVRVSVPDALALADAAVTIGQQICGEHSLALGLRAKANALWFMGECRPAAELFRQATVLFERAGEMDEVGRTLSSSIQSLILLGEYAAASSAAARAREIFTNHEPNFASGPS